MSSEAELAQKVSSLLRQSGLIWWRQNLGGVLQMSGDRLTLKSNPMTGFPDFAGLTPAGQLWFMELKSEKGRVSIQQEYWMKKLTGSGAVGGVIRTLEGAESFLQGLTKKP